VLPCHYSCHLLLQVFEINPLKAWSAIAITLSSVAASLYLISVSPWYLLPFAWFIAGTAFTGVSVSLCVGVQGFVAVSRGTVCGSAIQRVRSRQSDC
jgi:hypothetical protein